MFTLIIGVVFLILFLDLRSRIIRLEEKTGLQSPINRQQISGGGGQPVTALGGGGNLVPNPTMAGGFLATSLAEKQGASVGERFGAWLKEDWLLKLGVLLLLVGFGWLVTYAFMNNWIGPMGRIAFGMIAGALIPSLNNI